VATVKQYGLHEKSLLENITKFRSAAMHARDIEEKSTSESALSGTLKTLFAVAENYPELKANENFLQLQQSLETIESELQIARRYYNGTVRNYNIAIQKFPANLVARTTSFTLLRFFELTDEQGRNNPTVQF
jgi:LemA protein